MYTGPIDITCQNIVADMQKQKENYVMNVVQEMGITVNKEELLRALQYDRDMYKKGYNDGIKDADNYEIVKDKILEEVIGIIEDITFLGCNGSAHKKKVLDAIRDFLKEEDNNHE